MSRPAEWLISEPGPLRREHGSEVPHEQPRKAPRKSKADLRLLQGGYRPRFAELTPRKRLVALTVMVGVVLFGVVAFHVVLSQGQFRLESLNAKADAEQDQYQRLRWQVAQLESPARITSEAQNRLGMVAPEKVTPVTPTAADMPNGKLSDSVSTSTESTQDAGDWSKVKSQLNSVTK